MTRRVFFILLALALALSAGLLACNPPAEEEEEEEQEEESDQRPDLVAAMADPESAYPFCDRDEEGLYVNVKNLGVLSSDLSTTRVVFFLPDGDSPPIDLETPHIAGHGQETKRVGPFPIPPTCWDANCDFRITVDVNDEVDERLPQGEDNNSYNGSCLG